MALAIIGANLPDFDHNMKRMYVIAICLFGALITFVLYHFNLPFYLGIVIVTMGLVFFFSSHRGFTHSLFGMLLQGVFISLILFLASNLIVQCNLLNFINIPFINNKLLFIYLIVIFISIIFLNKNIFIVVLSLIVISVWKFQVVDLSLISFTFPVILGLLSHIVLDSFTPSGVKPFSPFSDKKYYKKFGLVMIFILLMIFLLVNPGIFTLFIDYFKSFDLKSFYVDLFNFFNL